MTAVCSEAALRAMMEDIDGAEHILRRHFDAALSEVAPRITADTVAFYEDYVHQSGVRAVSSGCTDPPIRSSPCVPP